jgi:hypothetical protein
MPDILTADDVAHLNGSAVARTAAFARLAGTALVAVGGLGAAAWLWSTVRIQMLIDGTGGLSLDPAESVSLAERLDAASQYVATLVFAGLAIAGGLALRLVADYTVARTGGTLTGYVAGDPFPGDGEEDAAENGVVGEDSEVEPVG